MQHAYAELLAAKMPRAKMAGLETLPPLSPAMRAYQRDCTEFGMRAGRWGLFLDTGLGKSLVELEWSLAAAAASNGRALLLTPLAVATQMQRESDKFGGYPIRVIREQREAGEGINVCNYDRLHLLEPSAFGAVCLDEASILKSMTGAMSRRLREAFAGHRWRMIATATPAPNDHTELGQSAEFLGVMAAQEMLMRWFIVDHGQNSTYRLKKHGAAAFWEWVASWARMASHPRDLGHPEEDFELPPMRIVRHRVDIAVRPSDGALFAGTVSATQVHDVKRQTAAGRASAVAAAIAAEPAEPWVIWCDTDYEADALTAALRELDPARVLDVRGSMSVAAKEERLEAFAASGEPFWLVTKPSVAGWGLNWQHCARMAFAGRSYSYESFYQAVRRCWRFGQAREVIVHLAVAEGEEVIGRVLERKADDHRRMQEAMAAAMRAETARQARPLETAAYDPGHVGQRPAWQDPGPVACMDDAHGEQFALYNGDCVHIMSQLPDACVDLSVFSPPFSGIFIYSDSAADMGNCDSDEAFLGQYRFAAEELYRITRPGRLCVVHCKDLRNLAGVTGRSGLRDFPGDLIRVHAAAGWEFHTRITVWRCPVKQQATSKGSRLNYKDLMRDATFSMMGLPEYLLVFRKWPQGEADAALVRPVAHNPRDFPLPQWQAWASPVWGFPETGDSLDETDVLGATKDAADEKHICPLPLDISDRAIRMWSNPGEVVCSPFAGIGSEGYSALKAGRRFIGAELKAGYFKQASEYLDGLDRQRSLFATGGSR